MKLSIFFDGRCPLCVAEMNKLRSYNQDGNLVFEDIHDDDFCQRFPHLNWQDLNARIHVLDESGRIFTGLDATYLAWKQVGKGWVYAPTRWPVLRVVFDAFYTVFAKHRYRISYLLTGKKRLDRCEKGTCKLP